MKLSKGAKSTTEPVSISERIFRRWCEKLRNEQTIPTALIKAIEIAHEEGKLSDSETLGGLVKQVGEADGNED